jgi:hypothetical protein
MFMTKDTDDLQDNPWVDGTAQKLVGSIVIVGITYVDSEDKPYEQLQYHGIIASADKEQGIAIECHSEKKRGETVWLPPQTNVFKAAPPGTYRLRSTGEIVTDPDYTCSYTITKAEHQSN